MNHDPVSEDEQAFIDYFKDQPQKKVPTDSDLFYGISLPNRHAYGDTYYVLVPLDADFEDPRYIETWRGKKVLYFKVSRPRTQKAGE